MRFIAHGLFVLLLLLGVSLTAAAADEQAVIIHLKLSDPGFGARAEREQLFALEEAVAAAVARSATGEHDGNEVGDGEFVIFCYGPDADKLYAAVEPALRASSLSRGGTVVIRYGKPGARQREAKL